VTLFGAPRAVVVDASAGIDVLLDVGEWVSRMEAFVAQDVLLLAPAQFRMEVANGLLRGQRQSVSEVRTRLRQLAALEVEISDLPSDEIIECTNLAARHGLTVHDAAYLHLALELDAELATNDKALAKAARAEGVVVHD
jgi:predicted nucleic acid-binding protein